MKKLLSVSLVLCFLSATAAVAFAQKKDSKVTAKKNTKKKPGTKEDPKKGNSSS